LNSFFIHVNEIFVNKVVIQGYPGSYHDIACHAYFNLHDNILVTADSFDSLADKIKNDPTIDFGVMAIENSIAGSIIQNYKIIKEYNLSIIGEIYLRIQHCLMCHPTSSIADISEIHSHQMAINQCRVFLSNYEDIKLINCEDTALSAKQIKETKSKHIAAIASERAAKLYGLKILDKGIEDNDQNYTRFFVVQKEKTLQTKGNKASIAVRLNHKPGALLCILQKIYNNQINLSKLQSFPVLGELSQYFFHLDLEFNQVEKYYECISEISEDSLEIVEFGIYKKADISIALRKEPINVML